MHRSFCFKTNPPSTSLLFVENRSLQQGTRCISGPMDSHKGIWVSAILPNRKGSLEGIVRKSNNFIDNTSLADSKLVSTTSPIVHSKPYSNPTPMGPFDEPSKPNTPSNTEPKPPVGGLDSFRDRIQAEGLSEKATELITASRRPGTRSHYKSAWGKWDSWCGTKQVDPFRCPLNFIIEFLTDSFPRLVCLHSRPHHGFFL